MDVVKVDVVGLSVTTGLAVGVDVVGLSVTTGLASGFQ